MYQFHDLSVHGFAHYIHSITLPIIMFMFRSRYGFLSTRESFYHKLQDDAEQSMIVPACVQSTWTGQESFLQLPQLHEWEVSWDTDWSSESESEDLDEPKKVGISRIDNYRWQKAE